jgi:hypothetical protein
MAWRQDQRCRAADARRCRPTHRPECPRASPRWTRILPQCLYMFAAMLRSLPAGFIAPCFPTKADTLPSGEMWLMDLVCKLDESGTNKQSPIVTVGGYVALASAWTDFELKARSIFTAYGVRYLHGVEFQNRKPPFNTWSPIKQRTFVIDLFDAVRRTVEFGVTFSVRKDAYLQAKKTHALNRNESAYGFAFRGALDHILRDEVIRIAIAEHRARLSFVVENGCANQDDLRRIFETHKAHASLADIMGGLDFADKKSTIALQTADFLAYQSRRYVAECEVLGGNYVPMPDVLTIMTDRMFYRDAVATGFHPTKPADTA